MKQLIFANLFAYVSFFSFAQRPPLNFYKITNEEGLSQATVNVIYKDNEGFLWIGTDDGLNRYDGKKIKTYYYQFNDPHTLAANEVYGLCEDKFNRIWIAHFNAGISIYDKSANSFCRLDNISTAGNKLSSNRVYGVYQDKSGFIWARTVTGISKIDPVTFKIDNYDYPSFADPNTINIDITDFAGAIWFGSKTKGLLSITRDGKPSVINGWNSSRHGMSVTGLYKETDQQLLFASEKGLFRIMQTRGSFNIISIFEDSILFRTANKLLRQKNSPLVWVATEKGILVINVDQKKLVKHVKSESIKDNLISNVVNYLLQDEELNVIVGTSRGINIASRYSNIFNNYENIFRKIPHFGHPAYAIHELKNQDILLGTKSGGAYIFNTASLKITSIPIPYSPATDIKVYHFTPLTDDHFFVSTNKGVWELNIVNNKASVARSKNFPELQQLNEVPVTDILLANDSIAYIASFTDGFFRWNYRSGILKQYKKNEKEPNKGPVDDQLQNIVFSKDKDVILCTKNGLNVYYPSRDSFFNLSPGTKYPYELPARNIKDAWDDGKHIWIATFGAGIQKFDKQTHSFAGVTTNEGLPNNSVYAVLPDNKGNLWIPTDQGLGVLNIQNGSITTYTTGDGLPDNEFNGNASYMSPCGNLYFSTLNGIVQTRPEQIIANPTPPKIVITELAATSPEQKDTAFNTFKISKATIPAGFNSLFCEFAALSFAAPSKNNYRVKLENFDKDWVELGNVNYRRYNNLPPGNYTLKVMASNNSGIWSKKPLSLNIYVTPFWNQTIWFKILFSVMAALIIFLVIRNYFLQRLKDQRMLYEKQLAIQEERQRIGSEIHDDIGAGLMGVKLLTEMVGKRTNDTEVNEEVNKINSSINDLSIKIREVVWSLNTNNDTLENLLCYIQKQAVKLFENSNTKFRVELPEFIPEIYLTGEKRRHIYLTVKEALHNTIKHANCFNVLLSVKLGEQELMIVIKDDGNGISVKDGEPRGYGLGNMKMRMEKAGGAFKMSWEHGTDIQLIIPLPEKHDNNINSRR